MDYSVLILLALLSCIYAPLVDALIDPVSVTVAAGAALGLYNFNSIKCQFMECCDSDNIPARIDNLKNDLSRNLFGQHIVEQHLVPALQAHFTRHYHSRKPLVISFHGTPGTGKNFVAEKIASNIYKKGLKSRFVHKYMGRADFPLDAEADLYSLRIVTEVKAAIQTCPESLFIFDEVDKIPPKTFEALASFVNYNLRRSDGDYTKAIFIFLSNTAGVQIAEELAKLLTGGTLRENTTLSQFEPILEATAYRQYGGLKDTSLIESHVIDHFIPFLPMEKSHVRKCVEAEFRKWGHHPKDEIVDAIINESITYDRKYGIFSTSGCKKLEKKVAVEANYGH